MTSKLISCAIFYRLAFNNYGIVLISRSRDVYYHLRASSCAFQLGIWLQSAHFIEHFLKFYAGRRVYVGVLHMSEQIIQVNRSKQPCHRFHQRGVFFDLRQLLWGQDRFVELSWIYDVLHKL